MTELTLIEGKPKVFVVSSNNDLINEIREYIEGYNYELAGYAGKDDDIFSEIDKKSPNLLFLDTGIEDIDLLSLAGDLELFNVPVIVIVGERFDETIDQLLTSNPFGYLLEPLEEGEVQRSMAVALKKHEQNILSVKYAEDKIKEKNVELVIEKSDSSFLLILCIALIILAVLTRNATWLQWLLLIPTLTIY